MIFFIAPGSEFSETSPDINPSKSTTTENSKLTILKK